MKTLITAFFMTLLIPMIHSQNEKEIPIEFNYFFQKELHEKSHKREQKSGETKESKYHKYLRWDYFHRDRVDRNGDLRVYPDKMFNHFLRSPIKIDKCENGCKNCCFPSDWQYLGPRVESQNLGRIDALWINPSDQNHILAGATGGLWKSLDGGLNWEILTDFCLPGIGISAIDVQPNNLDIIYISTAYRNGAAFSDHNYGFGAFKTTDGGANWTNMNIVSGSTSNKQSRKIMIHPVNHSNVYVAIGHEIYKTTNNGATWISIFGLTQNPAELQINDFEIITNGLTDEIYVSTFSKRESWDGCRTSNLPAPPGMYCWGTSSASGGQRFYSAKVWKFDSAQNSTTISGFIDLTDFNTSTLLPGYDPVTALVSISITTNSITIACQHAFDAGFTSGSQSKFSIFRKPVSGGSWSLLNDIIVSNGYGYDFPFEVSPSNDNIIYIGGLVLSKSNNAGNSYTTYNNTPISSLGNVYWAFHPSSPSYDPNQPGSHPDVRCLKLYNSTPPGLSDVVFFGTDGGISKTTDSGVTTENLNGNHLELTQFFGLSNNEILPNLIYGGTQDNGIFENKNQTWRNYPFGDAYDAVVDKTNPEIAYIPVNGVIKRTTDGGANWSNWSCPEFQGCWNVPLFINNNNDFYVGISNLWKRSGSSWINITNLSAGKLSGIDMSENGNIAYITYQGPTYGGSLVKKVYKITNLNTTPIVSDISAGLIGVTWLGITDVTTDDIGNTVWVSFGNFWDGNKKVFKYSSGAWSEYGQGLPDIPCNNIEHYKGSDGLVFLGTDAGVYYRDEEMSEWEEFRCGLPRTIITDLEINYELNRLRAATYSRGIWETPIPPNQGQISCVNPPYFEARISPSQTFNPIANNSIVTVNQKSAAVSIKIGDICQGGGCCDQENSIEWRVFKDGKMYALGSGNVISFSGQFQKRFINMIFKRHRYRIEIRTKCSGNPCGMYQLNFKG